MLLRGTLLVVADLAVTASSAGRSGSAGTGISDLFVGFIDYYYALVLLLLFSFQCLSLQCSDTVGWGTGRASGLYKVGCRFVGGDDLTGALHDL